MPDPQTIDQIEAERVAAERKVAADEHQKVLDDRKKVAEADQKKAAEDSRKKAEYEAQPRVRLQRLRDLLRGPHGDVRDHLGVIDRVLGDLLGHVITAAPPLKEQAQQGVSSQGTQNWDPNVVRPPLQPTPVPQPAPVLQPAAPSIVPQGENNGPQF